MGENRENISKVRTFIRKYGKQNNKHVRYNQKTIENVYDVYLNNVFPLLKGKKISSKIKSEIDKTIEFPVMWEYMVDLIDAVNEILTPKETIEKGSIVPYKFRGVDYGKCLVKTINDDEVTLISESGAEIKTSMIKLEKLLKPYYK